MSARRPWPVRRTCWSTSTRALGDDVRRLRRRHRARAPAASRRRATRAGRPAAATASRLRALVDAVQRRDRRARRAASRPARWRRSSGARSAGATRSARSRLRSVDVAARGRRRTRARPTRSPARRAPRGGACSAAAAARAAASGSAHGSSRRLGAGEDPVDAVVVQALVGADQRAVERARARRPRRRSSISTVTARRSTPGTSEQASLDSASGSIGSTAPGT